MRNNDRPFSSLHGRLGGGFQLDGARLLQVPEAVAPSGRQDHVRYAGVDEGIAPYSLVG